VPKTMRAIAKLKPQEGVNLIEWKVPKIRPKEVLVKVKCASICGTDLHIYHWDHWSSSRIKLPQIIGHEFSGYVIEVGKDVEDVKEGDYVSAESHETCGFCYGCRIGMRVYCKNYKILGVDRSGCFADYVVIRADTVWKNDKSIPPEVASVQEPLGNAMYVVSDSNVTTKSVLITGCGPFGLFATAIAKRCGATLVVAVEPNPYRRKLAKKVGADFILNPMKDDVESTVQKLTDGEGVQVVLEMSGQPQAIKQGLKLLRHGGRLTLFGLPSDEVPIDIAEGVIFKGAHLVGISGRKIFETWYQVSELLKRKLIPVENIITHKFPLEDFQKGFDLMKKGECGKVVLEVS